METAPQFIGASYARISDNDGAGPGVGTGDQHRRNRKRGQAEGITIAHELTDDDRSAYDETVVRGDYEKLLSLVRGGHIRFVLVKHADRLHRQPAQAEEFLRLARSRGLIVVTASGFRYHFDSAEGRKAFRAAAVDASYESEHRGERVADSHERRALEGEYRGGSRRPFGWGVPTGVYRRVRDKKTGKSRDVEILDMSRHRPAEAEEIRRWKRELLAGVDQAQVLRSIPMPTVTGNDRWTARTMQQILTNPRTSGHSVHRGEIVARDVWPAILTDDEREALRALFADPARKTAPGNQPKWLGSLIYRCGICDDGTTMTCRYVEGNRVYRCKDRGHCQRAAEAIDAYITQVAIKRLSRDDVADLVTSGPGIDVAALREQAAVCTQRKSDAALQFAAGAIDAAQLATITEALNTQISKATAQLAEVARESPLAEFIGADARTVWQQAGLGRQREILRALFTITLHPVGRGRRVPPSEGVTIADPR
ncbi:recombinase family protein [Nocardiopsis sp. CNT-189]|uniref:recombinase family protein n=1 Tax=Nocardiopsis oceanisediminis TaxID=2816862 RepID=UPI003B2F373A